MAQPIKEIPADTKFGRLTVRHRQEKPGNNKAHFLCGCECGGEILVRGSTLRLGRTSSCGCLRAENCRKVAKEREPRKPAIIKTGTRFGRLSVSAYHGRHQGTRRPLYQCVCDCGVECIKDGVLLKSGKSNSCGCLWRDRTAASNKATKTTHGMSHSPEYFTWRGMLDRCYREGCESYPHYGGRGIKVHDRWRESFESFYDDVGPRPSADLSLDRIDVNGDYEPGNCRWADRITQRNNQRPRLRIEDYSDDAILSEVSRRGLKVDILKLDVRLPPH